MWLHAHYKITRHFKNNSSPTKFYIFYFDKFQSQKYICVLLRSVPLPRTVDFERERLGKGKPL